MTDRLVAGQPATLADGRKVIVGQIANGATGMWWVMSFEYGPILAHRSEIIPVVPPPAGDGTRHE